MKREVALLGGPYDGEREEVEDSVSILVKSEKVGEGHLTYRRALAIDSVGRPVFAIEGLGIGEWR
jgi:hypothetical protein